jgi:two-component system, LytTR family, sensor histidine kinase AlgZ
LESTKRNWTISLLWTNLAVAVVVLILLLGNQISSVRELLHVLAYALVYANLVALLGLLLVGGLAKRLALRKLSLTPAVMVSITVVVVVGCFLVQVLLMVIGVVVPQHFWREYLATLRVSVPLAAVFGLGAFLHATLRDRLQATEQALREKELAEQRAQKLAAEARLRSLESRIQPHFLFNTLNSISSLIATDPVRAEQIVGCLAVLLRTSLDASNRSLIPLGEELAMVQSYFDIERARLGDKLRGSVDVADALHEVRVPPMSVQALVENAVKHGITPQALSGEVHVAASAEGDSLRIEVCDSGLGFDLAVVPPGHGLDNLVERLNALFGDKARLNAFRRDGHSIVEMVFPRV